MRLQFVEVDLARRQYEAVDPANRLVARELERRFENALQGLEEIESKTQAQMQKMDRPLTEEEQHTLKTYAEQLPQLWHAATTAAQERKRIVRCLIETVVVTGPRMWHTSKPTSTGLEVKLRRLRSSEAVRGSTVTSPIPSWWTSFDKWRPKVGSEQ